MLDYFFHNICDDFVSHMKILVTCWFESKVTFDVSNETQNFCTGNNTQVWSQLITNFRRVVEIGLWYCYKSVILLQDPRFTFRCDKIHNFHVCEIAKVLPTMLKLLRFSSNYNKANMISLSRHEQVEFIQSGVADSKINTNSM